MLEFPSYLLLCTHETFSAVQTRRLRFLLVIHMQRLLWGE